MSFNRFIRFARRNISCQRQGMKIVLNSWNFIKFRIKASAKVKVKQSKNFTLQRGLLKSCRTKNKKMGLQLIKNHKKTIKLLRLQTPKRFGSSVLLNNLTELQQYKVRIQKCKIMLIPFSQAKVQNNISRKYIS